MIPGLAAIGAGLGLAGAVQDLFGQEFQSDEATAARDFSAQQAQLNRDFQERMRSSQYQTAVEDMKKAGLNPMLAYHQGGAGTPTGAMAQSASASRQNLGGLSGMQTAAQIDLISAQADNVKADTQNKLDENPNIRGIQGIQNQTVALLREQAAQTESYRYLNDEQRKLVNQQIKNAVEENSNIVARTGNTKVDTVLMELQVPKARNEAEAQKSDYMKYVAPYTGELGKLTNSAADVRRAFRGYR